MRDYACILIWIVGSMVVLAGTSSVAETSAELKLLNLAQANFKNDVKPAEEILFRSTANGTLADCKQGQDANPANAATWGDDRIIRADRLKWLCTDPDASSKITSNGIWITGARIQDKVELSGLKMQFPLHTFKCAFADDINLERASLRSLELEETHIKGLQGDGLTVERDVFLSGNCFRAEGKVLLRDATIGGRLSCKGGQFIQPNAIALDLSYAKIGTSLLLGKGFRAEGAVLLLHATVGGDVRCESGQFINPRGQALDLEGAKTSPGQTALNASGANIQGDVSLDEGFEADGEVIFQGTRIEHGFLLKKVVWHDNAKLNLTSANAKTLLNGSKSSPGRPKQSWPSPNKLLLHGFTFDELDIDAELSAKTQIDWIKLQPQFRSQPYEQMAKVFRDMGCPEGAVKVMVAKNDDAGTNAIDEDWKKKRYLKILGDFFWYRVFGKLIDFGYHPWHALLPSVLLVLLGAALFELGFRAQIVIPTDDNAYDPGTKELRETYPKFNALIYSLETFVPLLKLEVSQYWLPNANAGTPVPVIGGRLCLPKTWGGWLRFYLWVHIIAGWILTTLWVGGLTGLIKS